MTITMEDIDERLKIVEDNTKKILFYLESDDKTKRKGFIEALQNVDERVRLLELQRKVERARNGILGGLIGGGVAIVTYILKNWWENNIR